MTRFKNRIEFIIYDPNYNKMDYVRATFAT